MINVHPRGLIRFFFFSLFLLIVTSWSLKLVDLWLVPYNKNFTNTVEKIQWTRYRTICRTFVSIYTILISLLDWKDVTQTGGHSTVIIIIIIFDDHIRCAMSTSNYVYLPLHPPNKVDRENVILLSQNKQIYNWVLEKMREGPQEEVSGSRHPTDFSCSIDCKDNVDQWLIFKR